MDAKCLHITAEKKHNLGKNTDTYIVKAEYDKRIYTMRRVKGNYDISKERMNFLDLHFFPDDKKEIPNGLNGIILMCKVEELDFGVIPISSWGGKNKDPEDCKMIGYIDITMNENALEAIVNFSRNTKLRDDLSYIKNLKNEPYSIKN